MKKHPLHLKHPDLHTSPEVKRAVLYHELQTGKKVPNDPTEQIDIYIERMGRVFLHPDEKKRRRYLDMARSTIYDELIIKRQNFPESYFELQQRLAEERGQEMVDEHGAPTNSIPPHVREQMIDVAVGDQKASLNAWMNYLTSSGAMYPPWFKYLIWRNITKLSQLDKKRCEFKKRTNSTVAKFPDIYREPLARILDIYEQVKNSSNLTDSELEQQFTKKFPTLYAELIKEYLAATLENHEEINGEWVKYRHNKKKDAEKLYDSLQNKGTGWCIAGRETANIQIQRGDFYAFYSNDAKDQPTNPRIAIAMDGNCIQEIRGIFPEQELEPIMEETLEKKLLEFGSEADIYRKKMSDMRRLTQLVKQDKNNEPFTTDELRFLYEFDGEIEGFGNGRDPRIAKLLQKRDISLDKQILFQITHNIEHKLNSGEELTERDVQHILSIWSMQNQTFVEFIPVHERILFECVTSTEEKWNRGEELMRSEKVNLLYLCERGSLINLSELTLMCACMLFPRTTELEEKISRGEELDKDDLEYLYVFHDSGVDVVDESEYKNRYDELDSRIQILQKGRDYVADGRILFPYALLIKDKVERGEKLSTGEISYLYQEIDDEMNRFSLYNIYVKEIKYDPKRIMKARNTLEDVAQLCEAEPHELALSYNDIGPNTRALFISDKEKDDDDDEYAEKDFLPEGARRLRSGVLFMRADALNTKKFDNAERINKIVKNPSVVLSKDDLRWLYKVDEPIEGTDFEMDRVENELMLVTGQIFEKRDLELDVAIMFDCLPDQFANNTEFINENTLVFYDGKVFRLRSDPKFVDFFRDEQFFNIIEKKVKEGSKLSKKELKFLYEIDMPIKYENYLKLNRIVSLLRLRNTLGEIPRDMSIIFNCSEQQVALTSSQLTHDTVVYVGELEPNLFSRISESCKEMSNIYISSKEMSYIYISSRPKFGGFKKITKRLVSVGEMSFSALQEKLIQEGLYYSYGYTSEQFDATGDDEFDVLTSEQNLEIVSLTPLDLGLESDIVSMNEVLEKTDELGLDVCPAQVIFAHDKSLSRLVKENAGIVVRPKNNDHMFGFISIARNPTLVRLFNDDPGNGDPGGVYLKRYAELEPDTADLNGIDLSQQLIFCVRPKGNKFFRG